MNQNNQDALKQVEAITNQLKQEAAALNQTLQIHAYKVSDFGRL